jgi:endonuclease/exonuclease/phosphatase (EEP) superfamily protein YafD
MKIELIKISLFSLTIFVLVLSIGKFLFWTFPLELLTHFQIHYFWLLVIISSILAIYWWQGKLRNRLLLCLVLFTLGLNLIDIFPWYLSSKQIVTDRSPNFKVMSFNICVDNTRSIAIVKSIKSIDPDLALVIEVTPVMMDALDAELKSSFPYNFRSLGGGIGLFSKLPLQSPSSEKFIGSDATNLVTRIEHHNRTIKIIGTHPLVPVKVDRFIQRNRHLQAIGNYLKNTQESIILLGDFNLTPWSPYYRKLIKNTALHNTRLGFGVLPTWIRPATHVKYPNWLLPIVNIPIDHIFVSKDIKVGHTYTGDNGNSDHAPLISELAI